MKTMLQNLPKYVHGAMAISPSQNHTYKTDGERVMEYVTNIEMKF